MAGRDAPLEVRQGGVAGRGWGALATASICKGVWLCEYKITKVLVKEGRENVDDGCNIVDLAYPVPGAGLLSFDSTRKYHQIGRYLNIKVEYIQCKVDNMKNTLEETGICGELTTGCTSVSTPKKYEILFIHYMQH